RARPKCSRRFGRSCSAFCRRAGAQFNGFIEGDVLTVASIIQGSAPISLGDPVLGVDIAYGTVLGAFVTGTGGVGTYRVSIARALGGASDSKAERLRRGENKRCVHRGGSPCVGDRRE